MHLFAEKNCQPVSFWYGACAEGGSYLDEFHAIEKISPFVWHSTVPIPADAAGVKYTPGFFRAVHNEITWYIRRRRTASSHVRIFQSLHW